MKIMEFEVTEKQLAAWCVRYCLENKIYGFDVPLTEKQHEEVCRQISKLTKNLSDRVDKIIHGKEDEIEVFVEEKRIKQETSGY